MIHPILKNHTIPGPPEDSTTNMITGIEHRPEGLYPVQLWVIAYWYRPGWKFILHHARAHRDKLVRGLNDAVIDSMDTSMDGPKRPLGRTEVDSEGYYLR